MGYMGLVFPHNADSDKQIQFDNLDLEHILAHNQWLYQAWELILAHTWTQKGHALPHHYKSYFIKKHQIDKIH